MAVSQFDARHPAPNVLVLPAPHRKSNLEHTQARNARRIDPVMSWDCMRPTMRCQPTGLGMPSTPRTARSPYQPIALKGCAPGTVTPGSRRRSPKPGPKNLGCVSHLPSSQEYRLRSLASLMNDLKAQHAKLVGYRGKNPDTSVEDRYERKRARIIKVYGRHVAALEAQIDAMEEQHVRLFGRKVA